MAYQFSDLLNDLMEMVFEALPSVIRLARSLVCPRGTARREGA